MQARMSPAAWSKPAMTAVLKPRSARRMIKRMGYAGFRQPRYCAVGAVSAVVVYDDQFVGVVLLTHRRVDTFAEGGEVLGFAVGWHDDGDPRRAAGRGVRGGFGVLGWVGWCNHECERSPQILAVASEYVLK
jgi:hypothetical protein